MAAITLSRTLSKKLLFFVTEELNTLCAQFWKRHPALLYGLALFLGAAFALNFSWGLCIPGFVFCLMGWSADSGHHILAKRIFWACCLMLAAFIYVQMRYQFPDVPKEGIRGVAYFEIDSLKRMQTRFGTKWLYRGTIRAFAPEEDGQKDWHGIPCSIALPAGSGVKHPPATGAYYMHGMLKKSAPHRYHFSVKTDTEWEPIAWTWSFAEYRYQVKEQIRRYLQRKMGHPQTASFMAGIVTGDFDDQQLSTDFARFGLQHIMAISGLHFGIIAAFLGFLLRLVFPGRIAGIVLLAALSLYFLLLGLSPSVLRAWVMAFIFFSGILGERRATALNSLGAALGIAVMIDPLMIDSLSFQFSFVTTAAILLFSPLFLQGCEKVWKKRALSEAISMTRRDQHGYILLSLCRESLALTLAVNCVALPVTLFYFHKFPLMGLIYNFFFPFLISISMMLLMVASLLTPCLPLIADAIYALNSAYTLEVLGLTYHMPLSLDIYLRVNSLAPWMLLAYLAVLFGMGVIWRERLYRT